MRNVAIIRWAFGAAIALMSACSLVAPLDGFATDETAVGGTGNDDHPSTSSGAETIGSVGAGAGSTSGETGATTAGSGGAAGTSVTTTASTGTTGASGTGGAGGTGGTGGTIVTGAGGADAVTVGAGGSGGSTGTGVTPEPIAFRSSSYTGYTTRTNTTVSAPAGIEDGDVLLYLIFAGSVDLGPIVTQPSGFAELSGGAWPIAMNENGFLANAYAWYKIASGESGNYTATHSTATTQAIMLAISGASSSQPRATTNHGSGPKSTALSIDTITEDSLVVFVGWDWGNSVNDLTPPSGTDPSFTERIDVAPLSYIATGVVGTAGPTGDKTQTNNNAVGMGQWAAALIAVESAAAGMP